MAKDTQSARLDTNKVYRCVMKGKHNGVLFFKGEDKKFYRCLGGREIDINPTENVGLFHDKASICKHYLVPVHVARDGAMHELESINSVGEKISVALDQSKPRPGDEYTKIIPLQESGEIALNESQEMVLMTTGSYSCGENGIPGKCVMHKRRTVGASVYHTKHLQVPDCNIRAGDQTPLEVYWEIVLSQFTYALDCGTKTHTQKITCNITNKEKLWLLSKDSLDENEKYMFDTEDVRLSNRSLYDRYWCWSYDSQVSIFLENVDNSSQIIIWCDLLSKQDSLQNTSFICNKKTEKYRLVSFDCGYCNVKYKELSCHLFAQVLNCFPDLSQGRQDEILRFLYVINNIDFKVLIESLPIRALPGTFKSAIEDWAVNEGSEFLAASAQNMLGIMKDKYPEIHEALQTYTQELDKPSQVFSATEEDTATQKSNPSTQTQIFPKAEAAAGGVEFKCEQLGGDSSMQQEDMDTTPGLLTPSLIVLA